MISMNMFVSIWNRAELWSSSHSSLPQCCYSFQMPWRICLCFRAMNNEWKACVWSEEKQSSFCTRGSAFLKPQKSWQTPLLLPLAVCSECQQSSGNKQVWAGEMLAFGSCIVSLVGSGATVKQIAQSWGPYSSVRAVTYIDNTHSRCMMDIPGCQKGSQA